MGATPVTQWPVTVQGCSVDIMHTLHNAEGRIKRSTGWTVPMIGVAALCRNFKQSQDTNIA